MGIVLLIMPHFSGRLYAQQAAAVLKVTTGTSPSVSVTLDIPKRRQLSFLTSVAGVEDLSLRITNLRLVESASGSEAQFRQLQPGEYLADTDFGRVSYDVSLVPSKQRSASAHASWIKDDLGILMLGDVLPLQLGQPVNVTFVGETPVSSLYMKPDERTVQLNDPGDAVFYIGAGWRMRKTMRCWECPTLFISGSWHFTDDEVVEFISEIETQYGRRLNSAGIPDLVGIAIARFPMPTEPGAWEAETRGRSLTIVSSDMPFRTQSLQRLHEQLRHEIFHLWIPNGVNLTGNYDWFYEGFALYQSLKLAVTLNRIRFEDFLDTLSRAHTIDSAYTQRPSLIEASRNRFAGTNTQVYARGMLVAFLTDLELMEKSKSSVEILLRTLYQKHRKPTAPVDGNDAVIGLMKANPGVGEIVNKYVTGKETIEWKRELAAAGIEDVDPGPITTLRVVAKPGRRQKTLLDKLGYNNWRKLSSNSK